MSPHTTRPRILLVEADHGVSNLLQDFLAEEGYALAFAASLEAAVSAVCDQRYHLVLADLFRPSLPALVSAVENLHQACLLTPLGLLSSWEIPPEAARRMPVAFVLPKPFDLEYLLRAVSAAVYASAGSSPSAEVPVQPEVLLAPL